MIHAVWSDQPQFRRVDFTPGFNLIIADRVSEASGRDSRNGLGKSTLVEIIHFVLGGELGSLLTLKKTELANWTFFVKLDVGAQTLTISRNTSGPRKTYVEGDVSAWPDAIRVDPSDGRTNFSSRAWTTALGREMFGLSEDESALIYSPTFRSLISYFARRGIEGYVDPFRHFSQQQSWDQQVNNAYLLDIGWQLAREMQLIRVERKELGTLKKAAKTGPLASAIGTRGELQSRAIALQEDIETISSEIEGFRVHPQYRRIEEDANRISQRIRDLHNMNITEQARIAYYERSFAEESAPSYDDVQQVYELTGISLPGKVLRQIDDVKVFFQDIIENRRRFLEAEIETLRANIAERDTECQSLDAELADKMQILRGHGALDDFAALNARRADMVSQHGVIIERRDLLRRIEDGTDELDIRQKRLEQSMRDALDDRQVMLERAVSLFNTYIRRLYQTEGTLAVDAGPSGLQFSAKIERANSDGVKRMQVFCYDLVLANLWSKKKPGPGFLLHDSIVFDGVDERQIATAMLLARDEAETENYQHICLMNSDALPKHDLPSDFDISMYTVMRLTDATAGGGLLGFRTK